MRVVFRALRATAVLALCAVVGCASGPLHRGPDDITVVAQFDNAAGLYVGNAVAVLGMPVGEVTGIDPKGAYVDVTMRVDGSVRIPANATAVTLSTSVLTDRHVEFTPVYRGGDTLRDGERLAMDRTRTPVGVDRLISMADRLSGDLEGQKPGDGPIARLLAVASSATGGNGDELRATMDELSRALRLGDDAGAQTRDTVTEIVNELSTLVAAAARGDQVIREFGAASVQLGDMLAQLDIGSGTTGAQITSVLRQADELLTANRGELHSAVADTATVLKALADYRDQLAEFLDLTPMLLANGYNAVDQDFGGARIHALIDRVAFDGQMVKEVCNILGLRQLGCSTGTLQDFGPDFGITDMLDAMSRLPR
ncbi:MCE family protein [Nocardia bovistercoris]|uniref:MCE family protein n=1 Tax=Nocardia bovistercoris TaxID=2785916 RepID=A0A931N164_9NOCA|nr:MCE family protein [Nocardia bovistercoris]MBH0778040.1 MCE family protein [Nocardia bovistercoris]